MKTDFSPYNKLVARMSEIALANSASSLLRWDQETYMPAQALEFRARQMAFFGGWAHRQFTSSRVGDWISACEQHGFDGASKEAVNIREWRRAYARQTKLPTKLVEEFQRTTALAREAWMAARSRAEFALFRPHLEKILDLNRRQADCWGYEASPYDALLEEFEPGARCAALRQLFGELRPAIVALLDTAVARNAHLPPNLLEGNYPVIAQQAFNREVAAAIGFDFERGRIDTTAHPFCTELGPRDCRLTTRYSEHDFTRSLYGVLHEAGHGLYEQGFNADDYGTPMGAAVSLGIHESQSRLWENHVGRNTAFWEYWHPRACHYFPTVRQFTPAQIAGAVNRVSPSVIRVEADQLTYNLHIFLRFDLEVKLLEGQVKVADVPSVWNEEFEKMFGLKVPDDAHGCLQDVHWSMGTMGYFPTYTLGNLNAAQLFHRALLDHPELEAELKRGHYGTLLAWLRAKVHQHGQRFRSQDLITEATGTPTQASWHLNSLQKKFGA